MKKIAILGIVIAMLFSLCGCTINTGTGDVIDIATGEIKEERFIKVYEEEAFYILADKETKVQYLVYAIGYKGGITILLDENGKPLLYESEDK